MQRQDLERLSREQLIAEAARLAVARPRVLTQAELVDEILRKTATTDRERARVRGWVGRARDLLARVVERGLHLPEAARALRRESDEKGWPTPPPPMPTVTLAEIYAAQGHLERALSVLDEVLAREPDHKEARAMRARFVDQAQRTRARAGREKEPSMGDPPSTNEPRATETPTSKTKTSEPPSETLAAASSTPSPAPAAEATTAEATTAEATTAEAGAPEEPPVSEVSEVSEVIEVIEVIEAEPVTLDAPPVAGEAVTAAEVLEEPALPDRYEVDEVVAIAVDPRTIYLYWEVRATTLARARARHPDGFLCVRIATVIASWEGPLVDTRDLRVDALYGDRFVRDVRPGSNVRVTVGWAAGDSFEPFAVGAEVTAPRLAPVETVAQEIARWEAQPSVAAFQRRVPEAPPASAPAPAGFTGLATGRPDSVVGAGARVPASAHRGIARAPGGPVDTGVALWGEAHASIGEHTVIDRHEIDDGREADGEVIAAWFEPGGSSELGRAHRVVRSRRARPMLAGPAASGPPIPGRAFPGRAFPGPAFPGASDLSVGIGASDLVR